MEEKFETYLNRIGMPDALKARVEELYGLFEPYFLEPVIQLIVTDEYDGEKKRIYNNLWFVSKNHVMETKSFVSKTNIDVMNIESFVYVRVNLENYNAKKVADDAKVDLSANTTSSFRVDFSGTGENVAVILDFLKECILPRFIRP